jgi:hypothetical protein
MLKIAALVCLLSLTPSVAYSQRKGHSWMNGEWVGTGFQIDTDSTWTMRLKVVGRRFRIEYPSLRCGGKWTLLTASGSSARLREKITSNPQECADNGRVVIQRLNRSQMAFRYQDAGSKEFTASAILNRGKNGSSQASVER